MIKAEHIQAEPRESVMKSAFSSSVTEILSHRERFNKPPGGLKMGLEMEASVLLPDGNPAPQALRNSIIEVVPHADPELGASQIEWRTDPIDISKPGGVPALVTQASARSSEMDAAAHGSGARILRMGTQPLIPFNAIERTDKEKYRKVPDFHDSHRKRTDTHIGTIEQIEASTAGVVALLNSLQCNLEAASLEDAVDLTNRSLMIGPMVVALSGNARFLEGKDTGFNDIRATAWEVSHDTRDDDERQRNTGLRIGLPEDYFHGIEDYFDRVGSHPFILDDPQNALRIGIGLFWQDTRIKIIGDSAVVEFRPVSIQPTVEEDIAVMLFYLGRLQWSRMTNEQLVPIDTVRENRAVAMQTGIAPFLDSLPQELERAKEALAAKGIRPEDTDPFFELLNERVRKGKTPSDELAQTLQQEGVSIDTLLQNTLFNL